MSENSEKPSNASNTATNDEKARSPEETGEIDAEVTGETPRPPRVARKVEAQPVDVKSIFGEPVQDTANAKAAHVPRPDAPPDEPVKRGRGRPRKDGQPPKTAATARPAATPATPGAPPVQVSDQRLAEARELLDLGDSLFQGFAKSKLKGELENYDQFEALLTIDPKQRERMAAPLARGLEEQGVQLPWYASLGIAAAAIYGPRVALVASTIKKVEEEKAKRPK